MIRVGKIDDFKAYISAVAQDIKAAKFDFLTAVEVIVKNADAENRLGAVAGWPFVRVFSYDAKRLSELTGKPYIHYLEQAREMLLEGQNESDVLFHFDCMIFKMEGR